MRTLPVCLLSAALILSIGLVNSSLAQERKIAPPAARSEDGSPQNFSAPAQVSIVQADGKANSDFMKDALEASDEQWNVIHPLLEKVQDLQSEASNSQGIIMTRIGLTTTKRGVSLVGFKPSHVANLTKELATLIDMHEATPAQIQAKLSELRQAKAQATEDLIKARKELSAVLNDRQMAMLALANILE